MSRENGIAWPGPFFGCFTGLEGVILDVKYMGGGSSAPPQSEYSCRFLAYMVAVTTVCCYTQENILYQTTHSTLITVEPKISS